MGYTMFTNYLYIILIMTISCSDSTSDFVEISTYIYVWQALQLHTVALYRQHLNYRLFSVCVSQLKLHVCTIH